jgi:hypothetical protein
MNFTDSPFEKMMKQPPRPGQSAKQKPPPGSVCRACADDCRRKPNLPRREETSNQFPPQQSYVLPGTQGWPEVRQMSAAAAPVPGGDRRDMATRETP